jgi:hypothetical protein
MFRILDKMRKQKAVYWAQVSSDQYNQPAYAAPIVLRVRWEDKTGQYLDMTGRRQLANLDTAGRLEVCNAMVYTGEDVVNGGVMMLYRGNPLDDDAVILASLVVSDPQDPTLNPATWEIRRFDKTPTLDADDYLRVAYL